MIKITFKNVGQGDSIILEWEKDKNSKIGILDCALHLNANPVLNHIISHQYTEIEFIILSHPHFDHFSGLRELLEYCASHKIVVNKLFITSQQVPDYLRVATNSVITETELFLLFKKIKELKKSKVIRFMTHISDDVSDFILNQDLKMKFLAPSTVELDRFLENTPLFDEEDPHNTSRANWLSTVLKIYTANWYVLLTSDASKQTLRRVGISHKTEFDKLLKLGQSPHHGASPNHYQAFWKTKLHSDKTPIVFSVGQNIYRHPSAEAVNFFADKKNGYEIFSTNQVGYLQQINAKQQTLNLYLQLAGSIHFLSPPANSKLQGDKMFSFSD